MRPLASAVLEGRLLGAAELVGGLALAAVAIGVEGWTSALVVTLPVGVFFAVWMYLLAYRRLAHDAIQDPAAPPTGEREPVTRTLRRAAVTAGCVLALMAGWAAVADLWAAMAAMAAGNGAALLWTSRRMRDWEAEHDIVLLREPRWRWPGGGIMDSRDFYALARDMD